MSTSLPRATIVRADGPLDERAREQANAHDEGEQEEEVDDPDAARDRRRMEVEQREDEERRNDGDHDTAQDAPHVLRRDVPPPAVVEAEGDEDREHDPDDERDDVPLEVAVVVAAASRRRSGRTRRASTRRRSARVDGDLPQAVPVDGEAHGYAGTPATERTASTTRSCCSRVDPAPHREREVLGRCALRLGERAFGDAEVRHRRLEVSGVT